MTEAAQCGCGCGALLKPGLRYLAPSHALRAARNKPKTRTAEHNASIARSHIERNLNARAGKEAGKMCPRCNEFKSTESFGYRAKRNSIGDSYLNSLCRECERERVRSRQTPSFHRKHHLRWKYGLTQEDYDRMLAEQGGGCAVCRSKDIGSDRVKHFHVDHCHATGKVRGLLCTHCNSALGQAGDSPARLRALADYLEKYQ